MTRMVRTLIVLLGSLGVATIAHADITAFLGSTTTPTSRPVKGFAIGAGLVIVGAEFEYANTNEDLSDGTALAPELRTFMFNGLVQTPIAIARFQPYATIGGGVYRETLSVLSLSETNFGTNVGGGAKVNLIGPLRLRLDYRVFNLRGTPRHSTVQRFYAGVNLKF